MTKQVVKIFRPRTDRKDEMGNRVQKRISLDEVINEFLKENPDHKIILTDYCLIDIPEEHDWEERALIVFEVSDSTSTGSGGRKKSKPKPKPSGKKPKREPREATDRGIPMPSGQKPYGRSWEEPPSQRIRQ